MYLSQFESLSPTHIVPQSEGLNWLAAAHARAGGGKDLDARTFEKLLNRYGCGPDKIQQRGTFLSDFTHQDWASMQVFRDANAPASIEVRQAFFREALRAPIARLYPEGQSAEFKNLIHVTCTGYVSPSVAQELVSVRGWGCSVQVLHAYHMGCYAALPAIRMAAGNLDSEILHTELCTLHLNPTAHEPEQLVIQSLFADGVIRYRASQRRPVRGFTVLEVREHIASETLPYMTWDVGVSGFRMTLAREVPKAVQGAVKDLVGDWMGPNTVYAIHPGGPRIIDAVKEALGLSEEQVFFSREILRKHGNMSSATLPHVWARMLGELPAGTPVVSMAFGPGLTLAASHMQVVA